MIIESIGGGYYAGIIKGLDLIVTRKLEKIYVKDIDGNEYFLCNTNPRLEIIKKSSFQAPRRISTLPLVS